MQNNSISGLGCSLVDYLYPNIDFTAPEIIPYLSKTVFDGGLIPGGLVFAEDLEKYTGIPVDTLIAKIAKNEKPCNVNIGGPAIVALINCAQLLYSLPVEVRYYGRRGNDAASEYIQGILEKTPLNWSNYRIADGTTPSTRVFSDPEYDENRGERMFVNTVGIAGTVTADDIPDHFFDSRILLFGATALLPKIHDTLGTLLEKGRTRGCISIVTTVYDFRNAKKNPGARWPLGDNDENYRSLDLLIADHDEALHLSNTATIDDAANFFICKQTPAFIITHGPNPVHIYSRGGVFKKTFLTKLPVSDYVGTLLNGNNTNIGDTTGCGDNFAGGVLASIAYQLFTMKFKEVDLLSACAWGIASGGFARFYLGGTYQEEVHGEKRNKIQLVFDDYRKQMKDMLLCVHDDFNLYCQ